MINEKELIKSFIKFVKIDSPTGEERVFSNFLSKELKKISVRHIQDKRGNIIAYIPGNGKPILLSAHIDTVEPGRGIKPVIKKGVIKSSKETILGADNKAVVAILFELIKSLKKINYKHRSLEILFSVSEEAGISGIDTINRSLIKSKEGLCFDCAKPVGTIITGSPFYISEKIKISGKSSDISSGNGINVIPALAKFLKNAPNGKIGKDSLSNIGIIKGGFVANALLSEVEIKAEVRSFNLHKAISLASKVKSTLLKSVDKTGCRAYFNKQIENWGYNFKKSDPLVKKTITSMSKIVSPKSIYCLDRYWGVSDANNLNKLGIKTINIGYGAKEPHTVRERIAISDILKIAHFMEELIKI